jgi:hypothetical protein
MTNAMTARLTVRNHGTNWLSLSKPVVELPGVQTQVREVQPGRQFEIELTFPPGSRLPAGEAARLTLATSHPQFPTVSVPVLQRQNLSAPVRMQPALPGSR